MPITVLSRQRSWIAILTVLAMVASFMAIATPAQATLQDTSATCPSTIPSAGFTDLGGLEDATVQAIDCLASYSITTGTTTTAFSPNNSVPRWQMALLLTRSATAMGVALGDGSAQGFNDISSFDAATEKAINQLVQLGVTKGTSATTFSPNDNVTRWQMALFLTRLATAAGHTLGDGSDQGFTDISGLDAATQIAINQSVQLGISDGTSATMFSPLSDTLRWHMALFLTRVLAADGEVPSGIRSFVFDPAGDIRLDALEDGVFTISGLVSGTDYQISLLDDEDVAVNGDVVFDDTDYSGPAKDHHHQRRFHR